MVKVVKREKKAVGRPPLGPFVGKRAVLNSRITQRTRQALEEAASVTGRSLSQEVEIRLEHSFIDPMRTLEDREMATNIRCMSEQLHTIDRCMERIETAVRSTNFAGVGGARRWTRLLDWWRKTDSKHGKI